MRFNDSIVLMDKTWERMPNGAQVPVCTQRQVFCNRMSIGLSARLAGGAEGLMGAERVRVRALEYQGEQFAVYQGRELTIDSVSSNGEFATLTMTQRLGTKGAGDEQDG